MALAIGAAVFPYIPITGKTQNHKLRRSENAIPNRYIVVLTDEAAGEPGEWSLSESLAEQLSDAYGGKADRIYTHAINGYAAELTPKQAKRLSEDPRVKYVEEDAEVWVSTVQPGAIYNLDRIDQRDRPLDGNYNYSATGANVNAYIIDTGIRVTHTEFAGRAILAYDAIGDGQGANDCHGHGTHVAGTVGSTTYGVAKNVRLYAVRVMNCQGSGSYSGVIAGVDWVTRSHVKPAVANMSLSAGGISSAIDDSVTNSIASGVTYAIAAANNNDDACNYSPARTPNAITVGSTTSVDERSHFSNYGTCLDIFAPGSSVLSTWIASDNATATLSGTSMASPHVAGVAALYLETDPTALPAVVRQALIRSASDGRLTGINAGSPNLLLYSLVPTPAPTPTPTPTPSCGGSSYSGSLAGTGASVYYSYSTSASGTHNGSLTGPANANFDLYLDKQLLFLWSPVASSTGATSTENIRYTGTPGSYRWRVYSAGGSGAFVLCSVRP